MNTPHDTLFFPPQASTVAGAVDDLYYLIYYICVFFFVAIVFGGAYLVWKYRKREGGPAAVPISHNTALEVMWSVMPLFLLIIFFALGYRGYLNLYVAPRDAMEINVVAKKWSWDFYHGEGIREPGELTVPVHKPIKLILISQDNAETDRAVLHSFFVPAFRIKQDVIPYRYTTLVFEATQVGDFQVYCTEYCGESHSNMWAKIHVLETSGYDKWKESQLGPPKDVPLAEVGKDLFSKNACVTCHSAAPGGAAVGPALYHKFGTMEHITGGPDVLVDENYVRESILKPTAKVVQGFQPVMPPFEGQLKDWQIDALIAYIKSLK